MLKKRRTRFVFILVIISLLSAFYPAAFAQPDFPPVSIVASWADSNGNPQQAMAQQLSFPGYENAYWLYLPQEAVQADAMLSFADNYGQYPGGFTQPNGTPLSLLDFEEAGSDLSQEPVYFQGLDANGAPLADFMLYISTQAEIPAPPTAENAVVFVRYLDRVGDAELLPSQTAEIAPGTQQTFYAENIDNYTPETSEITVTVDANGMPDMPEVVFYYNAMPVANAVVNVRYVDRASGAELGSTTVEIAPGTQQVLQAPQIDSYTPETSEITVTVDENGISDMPEVVFYYNAIPVANAVVNVRYIDSASGANLLEPQTVEIAPGTQQTFYAENIENYTPETSEITVTVDENGMPNMPEVVFYYNAIPVANAVVNVRYVDRASGAELGSTTVEIEPGTQQTFYAENIDNYTPETSEITVTVDANGMPDMPEVVFYYNAMPVANAVVNVRYVDRASGAELGSTTVEIAPGTQQVLQAPQIDSYTPETSEITVTVDENGISDMPEVVFYYNAIPVANAVVNVRYIDRASGAELGSTTVEIAPGTQQVLQAPQIENYTPETPEITVTVDENGMPDMPEVVFYYNAIPVANAVVNVRYVDKASGAELGSTTVEIAPGTQQVLQAPQIDSYTPETSEITVTVDANGMLDMPEVVFYYNAAEAPTEVPTEAPSEASVTVRYIDKDTGLEIAPAQTVKIPASQESDVYAQPDGLEAGYALSDGIDVQKVYADEKGVASPSEVIFYYTKMSLPKIKVYFLEEGTDKIVASEQEITLNIGENVVEARPENLLDGYEISGESRYTVNAAYEGATPDSITFYYKQRLSAPVDIMVHYLDTQGNPVASSQKLQCADGTNAVEANPEDLKEGFALSESSPKTQYVIVKNGEANPSQITFVYEKMHEETQAPTSTPKPAPKVALVKVYYRDQFGKNLIDPPDTVSCVENEENLITVDESRVDASLYQLASEKTQKVVVDSEGNAAPNEVVFLFKDLSVDRKAEVTVRYLDTEGSSVAPDQVVQVGVGETIIKNSFSAPEGYKALEPFEHKIVLSRTGELSIDTVVFTYEKLPSTPTPSPSEFPYEITPMDRYAYPRSNSINFRSEPRVSKDNVISVVTTEDLAHITGSLVNSQDELWYEAEINGQKGFIRENVTRLLSKEEAESALGYTSAPTKEPTPEPSAIVDGVPINRWGVANVGSLNTRKKASKSADVVAKLKKGDEMFVFQQQTVDGEAWYVIKVNNKDAFVSSEFVDIMSQEESDRKQASLNSPVPGITLPPVDATDTPSPTFTAIPVTATPVPATAPPAAYLGYALTTRETNLSTGVGNTGELTIALLPKNTIVLINGQTYVDGIAWDMVDALPIRQNGYVKDSDLKRISSAEAEPYLNALQAAPAATPTAAPPLQQFSGFGITNGQNVPMRADMNTNAKILEMLPRDEIVQVYGQEYGDGDIWHISRHSENYGFIRQDQLRLLSLEEEANYLASLRVTLPPIATPQIPPASSSLSSYGYVTADKVRLRKDASRDAAYIKMMDHNQFALVLGSKTDKEGKLWYHINQAGTEGYVMSDYFTVLPMNQLTSFLQSEAYLEANTGSNINNAGNSSNNITPVEDFNTQVWTNPNLSQASYEPFNPLGTPTPNVEEIVTPTPDITPTPTVSLNPLETDIPEKAPSSSFPTGLLVLSIVAVLGAGGYYGYYMYTKNRRNEAQRAAKRKMLRQDKPQGGSGYAPPNARTPGHRPPAQGAGRFDRNAQGPQSTTQFRPPQSGAQGPQSTAQFRPPQSGAQGPQSTTQFKPPQSGTQGPQSTTQFRPPQSGTQGPQSTTQFKPPQSGTQGPQPTTQFRPDANKPTSAQGPQSTAQFRPDANKPTSAQGPQSTTQFKPPQSGAQGPQSTTQFKPPQSGAQGSEPANQQTSQFKPNQTDPRNADGASEGAPKPSTRHRRADRHDKQ